MNSGPNIPRAQRKRKPIEITLDAASIAKLDAMAKKNKMSRSRLIDMLIIEWLP